MALFLPTLGGGGAEGVMLNLARGFVGRGIALDFVLAKGVGPRVGQVPPEARVVDLKASRVLASLPGLVTYLRRERPSALLSAMDHANVVALWACVLAGVRTRLVGSVHEMYSVSWRKAPSLRGRMTSLWISPCYRRFDAMVAVSRSVADELVRYAGLSREKVHVIYNPVVTADLYSKATESLGHVWFAPGAPPVILGVGRLTILKDFVTLIRAFDLVRKERPLRLMILGEGEERAKLEELVRDLRLENLVMLPGFVENPYKYMKRAAVFVLSSRGEGLGNVLIEALALGTPVVSTDCPGGPTEILMGGKWGKLVPQNDHYELARAILQTLDSPFVPMSAEAIGRFDARLVVDQYLKVLDVFR